MTEDRQRMLEVITGAPEGLRASEFAQRLGYGLDCAGLDRARRNAEALRAAGLVTGAVRRFTNAWGARGGPRFQQKARHYVARTT